MKNNLIFIGMPAVGKSTVGVLLAKTLGYGFIDTDLVLQQQKAMYQLRSHWKYLHTE